MINMGTQLLEKQTSPSLSTLPIFGIHGGGNIGLGCMADIVSRSRYHYHIIASSRDEFTNTLINSHHRFWLAHGLGQPNTCVSNVSMVDAKNPKAIEELYCHSDVLAICLTEKALVNVARNIALALQARLRLHPEKPLDILILMNRLNSKPFVEREITKALKEVTKSAAKTAKVLEHVRFIPTVVDRIVNKIDKKSVLMQIRNHLMKLSQQELSAFGIHESPKQSLAASIDKLLSDQPRLLKEIPKLHIPYVLFNAEKDFSLYVPQDFSKINHFQELTVVDNLDQFAEIKNKYINGPHATLAWIGGLMGYTTIGEAINHPSLMWFITNLMEREIAPILKAEYPDLQNSDLALLKTSFIKRCKASFDDPIVRVGRDPLRKLQKGGRIQGVIELKHKHGLKIATPELERGMAAGILYAVKKVDPMNEECQKIRDIYRLKGSYRDVLCYKESSDDDVYPGLDSRLDKALIHNILQRISSFERIYKIRRTHF